MSVRARVVGLGQPVAGDDGVGIAVLRYLRQIGVPAGTELFEVADATALLPLLETSDPVVIIDAVVGHGTEGEVLELDGEDLGIRSDGPRPLSTHGVNLGQVIGLARLLHAGAVSSQISFVGVTITRPDRHVYGLSPAVLAAVPRAAAAVRVRIASENVAIGAQSLRRLASRAHTGELRTAAALTAHGRGLAQDPDMATFKKIIVPIDFSDTSLHALDYAIEMAKKLGASVTVMHAFELPIFGFPDGALVASAEVAARITDGAIAGLKAAIEARKNAGVPLESALRQGPADEEVEALVKATGADLIVIGTHGRRGLARALLGSVAEKVVRTASCPVLTVHAPSQKIEGKAAAARA